MPISSHCKGRAGNWAKAEEHYRAGRSDEVVSTMPMMITASSSDCSRNGMVRRTKYRTGVASESADTPRAHNNLGQVLERTREVRRSAGPLPSGRWTASRISVWRGSTSAGRRSRSTNLGEAIAEAGDLVEPRTPSRPSMSSLWQWRWYAPETRRAGSVGARRRSDARPNIISASWRPPSSVNWIG